MALQGTLDTFALPDVLRLLDTTKNSGCLRLNADAGTGSIHLVEGAIVSVSSSRVAEHRSEVDVVFDLLRFTEGGFEFEVGVTADQPGASHRVDELLIEAEAMLAEWRDIERVVPSLDHWVSLAFDLPDDEVVVSSARWRTIAAVGSGTTVRLVGEVLDLGEVDVCRTIKDLVESGMAEMGEDVSARTVSDRLSSLGSVDDSAPEAAPVEYPPPHAVDPVAEVVDENVVQLDMTATPEAAPVPDATASDEAFLADVFPGLAGRTDVGQAPGVVDEPDEADELSSEDLSRQLANLSPRAAAAVQAASHSGSEEEIVAAIDAVDEDDETINRGLLLKFLGSVNS